jgi:hypothetical protein
MISVSLKMIEFFLHGMAETLNSSNINRDLNIHAAVDINRHTTYISVT